MSKKKALILLLSAFLIGFLLIKPFNLFCRSTDKCQPIILSFYMPDSVGKENYEIFFDAKNFNKDIKFETNSNSVIMLNGAKNEIEYHALNISNHDVTIRPTPYVYPPEAAKYIKFYECLCNREHKIKKGDKIKMVARFKLTRDIENDPVFQDLRIIRVGYQVN